jgi:hypothetical protein
MNSVESGAEGIGIEHITLHDFRVAAHACSKEFWPSSKAAYTQALSLQMLQQPASDISGGSGEEYQCRSM